MDRRKFLGHAVGAGAVASVATAAVAAPALALAKRQLKMVTAWPLGSPGMGASAARAAKRIEALTDGSLTIKLYAANELAGAFETFDAVSNGAADMYHGAEYDRRGKNPAYNFFTAIPFGLTAAEFTAWIHFGGGQELWDEVAAPFNIKPFLCSNAGAQMGGWYNREIKKLDDLKGLRVRITGLGGEALRRLGATPVTIPAGEIIEALDKRIIDASEGIGPWNDLALGFHRAAKFYYWPGWNEPGSSLALGVNLNVWNSLSKGQQAAVVNACAAENNVSLAECNHNNTAALKTLIEKHKVRIKRFPNDVLTALGTTSGEVLKGMAANDAIAMRVYDSFMAARNSGATWSDISDEGYLAARRLPFHYV
jgi:TRAP-type mannitol/chloroaromatic compound transport system substrate-binding protein